MPKMTQSLSINEQVSYLRVGIELGVFGVSDIVQWADDQIATQEDPAYELIELSLMRESSRHEIANQLVRTGAPSLSRVEVLPCLLAEAHKRLLHDPDFGRVLAERLYRSWSISTYDFPEILSPCGYFDDAYSLAESGVYGTVDQISRELLEFTSRFQNCTNLFRPK
jgi:hypothetical protein